MQGPCHTDIIANTTTTTCVSSNHTQLLQYKQYQNNVDCKKGQRSKYR